MTGEAAAGTAGPRISIAIASYRRLDRLPALVSEYLRQGADEVVAVLDGPHPGWPDVLADVAADPRVRVIELDENRGLALARVAALRASSGDVVLAADDDVMPRPGLVDRHRTLHGDRGDLVVLGYMPVRLPERRGPDESPARLYARDYEMQARVWDRGDSAVILGSLWGGSFSLPRDLYERAESVKPSERLEYNEDLDLGLRLIRLGASARFDRSARADHLHRRTLSGFMAECAARGRAVAQLEARWGERPPQLTPLVTVTPGYSRALGRVQRAIARRDAGGGTQTLVVGVYRVSGALRLWRLQDAATRLLRRALIMRGYRLAISSPPQRG